MRQINRKIAAVPTCVMMLFLILLIPLQALAENAGPETPEPAGSASALDMPSETTVFVDSQPEISDAPVAAPQQDDTLPPSPDALFTVRFFDWDNTPLGPVQSIAEGEAAIAPEVPNREGYRFTGWSQNFDSVSSNMDIYAQYIELDSYTITISYIFANSTIALQPVVYSVAEGGSLHRVVDSPIISGYTPDQDSIILALDNVQQDFAYTVVYTPAGDTPYRVEHYLQNLSLTNTANPLDSANFTLEDTDTLSGETGAAITAAAKEYTGFSPPAALPFAQIAADGGTVLRVYYTRNQYAVYFDTDGGSYVAPFAAPYQGVITPPAVPSRAGYTFTGWSPSVPLTMPAGDVTVTANWQATGPVEYTLVYWLENIDSTGYDYVGTATASGTAGAAIPNQVAASSGVTFPIGSAHYTFDSTKTNAEKPATINGDGTTIVNKYYNRDSYTIRFTFSSKYRLTVNGNIYTNSYQFTAKYGAPISTFWPGTPTLQANQASDGNFIGWTGNSTNYVTRQYYLNDSLIAATPLAASWSTATRPVTVSYYFRNLADTAYELGDQQVVAVQTSSTTWNSKTFVGFTATESSKTITNNTVSFNYTRNKYNITYYNGGLIARNETGVPYQADLSGYSFTPGRPASVPLGYVFEGWYTTPQAYEGSKFTFTGATMPAHSLILYAHWVKPQYTITFVPDNGDASFTQTVYALATATQPTPPTKPGYVFGGWYLPSSGLRYVFSFPVNSNLTLTARWIAQSNITYDVVYMKDGDEYQRFTYGSHSVGDSVTASAITIPGYLPDALSKGLTLQASENEIIFYYQPFAETTYTVHYEDINGVELEPAQTHTTTQASVTENYINIPGYYPNFYQQTLQLTPNAADNRITFVYTKNADVDYSIRIFQEDLNGGYTLADTLVLQAPAGSLAVAQPPDYTGFVYQPAMSVTSRVVASDGSTLLRLYYNRDVYTINFTATGPGGSAGQTVFGGIKYKMPFGSAVTVPDTVAQPGYAFTSWAPSLPAGTAEVTESQTYTGAFVRDDAQWATVTLNANGAGGSDVTTEWPVGTDYTLPANPFAWANHEFLGWDEAADGTGTSYSDGGAVPITGNVTLYAQWVEDDKYAVVYLNNGGAGTVSDPNPFYYDGATVTVENNTFMYPGYRFTAWLEADGTTAYAEGDTFEIHQNMVFSAQWERDNTQWATIVYNKNDADASGIMAGEEVLVNQPHTLAANRFVKANFSFAGWDTVPAGGGTQYGDAAVITPSSYGTLTLYAQWVENPKYTITYHANDGTGIQVADAGVYGGTPHQIFGADTFTYRYHDFGRWTTNNDGTGTSYYPGSNALITGDMDLYAYWIPRRLYEITYMDGFGSGYFEQDGYAEDDGFLDVTVADNPFIRLGYDFVDWKSDGGAIAMPGTTLFDVEVDMVFTAEWTPTVYNITYELDGGTVNGVNPNQYTVETPTFMLVNPTKPGYSFEGWTGTTLSGETEEVRIGQSQMGDLSFTAHWEYDPAQWATITFVSEDESKGTLEGTLRYEGVIGEAINLTRVVSLVYPLPKAMDGYRFGSWSDAIPDTFPGQDMVITAYWILEATTPAPTPDSSVLGESSVTDTSNNIGGSGDNSTGNTGQNGISAIARTGDTGALWPFALPLFLSVSVMSVLIPIKRRLRGRHGK